MLALFVVNRKVTIKCRGIDNAKSLSLTIRNESANRPLYFPHGCCIAGSPTLVLNILSKGNLNVLIGILSFPFSRDQF